ncbi:hypothetical protein CORAM0001_1925 [Corynebacterium amycolatum SK46]|nr:hypothetical protein CORAM0001_1925 [Corynebacterium amycolatum SK46]
MREEFSKLVTGFAYVVVDKIKIHYFPNSKKSSLEFVSCSYSFFT